MTRAPLNARRPLLAGTAVAVLALVAACASGEETPEGTASSSAPAASATATADPAPSPSGSATGDGTAADDAEADAAAPAFGSTADGEASADALLSVTGLRLGTHDAYDRVVVDLGGTGTPGWHAERAATAVEDPTGETVDLGGAGVLALTVTGLGYPYDTGQTELGVGTRTPAGTVVTGAEFTGTFEGQTQIFLGLTDPEAPYRVFLLQDPLRLVVDVQR
ncbi:AMIN-like domain-containing (lipo)protein [Cellulomonas sp. Marseille-Q8402]